MGSHRVHGGWHPPCCRERSRHKSEQRPRHPCRTRHKSCSLPLHVLSLETGWALQIPPNPDQISPFRNVATALPQKRPRGFPAGAIPTVDFLLHHPAASVKKTDAAGWCRRKSTVHHPAASVKKTAVKN